MANEQKNGDRVPVYLSFKTFQSAVQNLRAHGLPTHLDRTTWDSRSGAEQTQIITAFKFLGLIDEAQNTQDSLRQLVKAAENSDEERVFLASLLQQRYAKVFALDLENTTSGALESAIGEYGATGTTRDRAVRFFIKAAEHARIKMSTRLTRGIRTRSSSGAMPVSEDATPVNESTDNKLPRRRRRYAGNNSQEHPPAGVNMKTISLPEVGGTLTVSGTFNYFELEGDEQELVLDIISKLKTFEKTHKASGDDEQT